MVPRPSRRNLVGLLATLVACLTGCFHKADVQTVGNRPVVRVPRAGVRLSAGSVREATLFGDLAKGEDVRYVSRPATGLLQHTFTVEGANFDPDVSADGKHIVFASTRHSTSPDLYYKAADGRAVTQLTCDPAADVQPALSPDQSRVAFSSNRSGNWDIWVVGLDGTKPTQLTSSTGDKLHPSWSPDGSQIAYCCLPPHGQWELWIADAASGGNQRFVGYGLFPEWAPQGQTIVYQRARERGSRWFSIWRMDLHEGEPGYPTEIAFSSEAALITPTWSPDGTYVAFAAVTPPADGRGAGVSDIWIVDAEGRHRMRLTDGQSHNYTPVWASSGRVFFTSSRGGAEAIWSVMPSGGDDQPTGMTASGTAHAAAARSGR